MQTQRRETARVVYLHPHQNKGWFAVERGWSDDPLFKGEAFTRRDAYLWLRERAAFSPHEARDSHGRVVRLAKGQLVASLRGLAKAWGWRKDRVARFLKALSDRGFACVENATADATADRLITICGAAENSSADGNGATAPATTTRQRRDSDATAYREEEREEGKKEDSPPTVPPSGEDPAPPPEKPKGRRAREPAAEPHGARLPEDWQPAAEDWNYAAERGFTDEQIEVMAERFYNHWTAKVGKEARKRNWRRAWFNWVLGEVERRQRSPAKPNGERAGRLI